MALSNIFNEPRREITESAIGIIIFGSSFVLPGVIFALHFGPKWADRSCGEVCSTIATQGYLYGL